MIYQLELEPNEPVPDLIDFIDETTPHRIETIEGHEFLYEFHPTEPHVYAKMPNGLILHGALDAWRGGSNQGRSGNGIISCVRG
jgi:hypothetical protein